MVAWASTIAERLVVVRLIAATMLWGKLGSWIANIDTEHFVLAERLDFTFASYCTFTIRLAF